MPSRKQILQSIYQIKMTLLISLIIFVLVSVLTFFSNNLPTRIFYTTVATWLGCAFYLFLASCVYDLTLLIFQIFRINISLNNFNVFCVVVAVIVSIYGVFHARKILIKNIQVKLPNLSARWHGRKAVFISDIHLGAVSGKNFSKKIADKINKINPDIIFIGGDLYDGVKVDEVAIIKPFADLHPAFGTYFVTGNHEEFRDDKHFLDAIKNTGIRVLNNEMVMIDGLQLIGVDDRDSTRAEKFKNILANLNIDKNKPSILLKHQPSQLDEAFKSGISFQISGHTHKAQVFPLNIFTKLIFRGYDYGFKMWDKMIMYTSSGVGTWGPPLRVGSDSEIVVFKFDIM
jgi:predicted MPP superfamily phosphohydrolase